MLAETDIGSRVVVRRRVGSLFTDLLGELTELTPTHLSVRTRAGVVQVPLSEVHRAKPVPARRPTIREIAALEQVAADSWPAPTLAWLGDWRVRAASGYTGRANSALPIGDPGVPLREAVEKVVDFYRGQGLPPQIDVPLPIAAQVEQIVLADGWRLECEVAVRVADLPGLIAATPAVEEGVYELGAEPSAEALELIAGRRGELSPDAMHVLTRVDQVVFAERRAPDGTLEAMARGTVVRGWLGVFTVEVAASARRRGLGTEVMGVLARWGDRNGATRAFLQVLRGNEAAEALYDRLGFTDHHDYRRYRRG